MSKRSVLETQLQFMNVRRQVRIATAKLFGNRNTNC